MILIRHRYYSANRVRSVLLIPGKKSRSVLQGSFTKLPTCETAEESRKDTMQSEEQYETYYKRTLAMHCCVPVTNNHWRNEYLLINVMQQYICYPARLHIYYK